MLKLLSITYFQIKTKYKMLLIIIVLMPIKLLKKIKQIDLLF